MTHEAYSTNTVQLDLGHAYVITSIFFVGCNRVSKPQLQRRFNQTAIKYRSWMSNYIPLVYKDALLYALITMLD